MIKPMKWGRLFKSLFFVQVGVNLVGALGPEISFDALWYHLPLARLAVERGWWGVIPGGLLYTSGIPRIIDWVNAALLKFGYMLGMESPEHLPKLLSFAVGVACAGMIYKIVRRYVKGEWGWLAAGFWYSSLVVGWQSMVVYVDLHRTLFILLAIWWMLEWWEKNNKLGIVWSGLFWGLAYSTKMMSGVDLLFLTIATLIVERKRVGEVLGMAIIAGAMASLWGVGNVLQGYNFFYPLFGQGAYIPAIFDIRKSHLWSPFLLLFHPRFRTGPLMLIPFVFAGKNAWKNVPKQLLLVGGALTASWWFTPANIWKGDGRYFLPALAMMAIAGVILAKDTEGWKRKLILGAFLLQVVVGVFYRALANTKFVSVVVGYESKDEFLVNHLDLTGADWYDVDGWVRENLRDKKYLVVGVHNTYYLPGSKWDHESWADRDYCYEYVLVEGEERVGENYELVHEVGVSRTRIYRQKCE